MSDAIQQLARLHGIADAYHDYLGQPCVVAPESQAAILAAMGVPVDSPQAVARSIKQFRWW